MRLEIFKKNKLIIILLLFFIAFTPTFGRFVYNEVQKNFLQTKNFYFESGELKPSKAIYRIDNYNGVDTYGLNIDLSSFKNNNERASVDVEYSIEYSCSANADCSTSKTEGIIYSASNIDNFTATISPKSSLNEDDLIWIDITATSSDPYVKEISAIFLLKVGYYGLSHKIEDNVTDPYMELKITNTLDYYNVIEAFGSYSIGDKITIDTYRGLSQVNKNKCYSSYVELEFDPTVILLDMTNYNFKNSESSTQTNINGYNYINSFVFKIEAQSSAIVRFYKTDSSDNFTYPIVNSVSVVDVSYY